MDGSSDPFENDEPIVDSSWYSVRWSNHAMTSCGSSASWEWRYSNCSESQVSHLWDYQQGKKWNTRTVPREPKRSWNQTTVQTFSRWLQRHKKTQKHINFPVPVIWDALRVLQESWTTSKNLSKFLQIFYSFSETLGVSYIISQYGVYWWLT